MFTACGSAVLFIWCIRCNDVIYRKTTGFQGVYHKFFYVLTSYLGIPYILFLILHTEPSSAARQLVIDSYLAAILKHGCPHLMPHFWKFHLVEYESCICILLIPTLTLRAKSIVYGSYGQVQEYKGVLLKQSIISV